MMRIGLIVSICIFTTAATYGGTTYTITVTNQSFTPHNTTAMAGDTIKWVNVLGLHGLEYVPSLIDFQPAGNAPWTKIMLADTMAIGNYPYRCNVHTTTMKDTFHIIEVPPPPPPTVPQEVTIIRSGNDAVLSWLPSANATHYNIYTGNASNGIPLTNLLGTTVNTSFVHENVFTSSTQRIDVAVLSNQFVPSEITVHSGDTIRWTNNEGFHNVHEITQGNAFLSDEFPQPGPWVYEIIVSLLPGNYAYQCDAHFSEGMTGVVHVELQNPNLFYQVRASNDEVLIQHPQPAPQAR